MDTSIVVGDKRISMMVSNVTLSSPVDIEVIFSLLPTIKRGILPPQHGTKLPHCKKVGSIIGANYMGVTRGLVRRKKTFFKNSVNIDISCKEKNANIKLSTKNIHLCGVTSEDMIKEVTGYLINYIKEIQELLSYAAKNVDLRDKTIDWLKQASMGIEIKRTAYYKKGTVVISKCHTYHLLRAVSAKEVAQSPDQKLAKFYLRMLPDLVYYNDYCKLLDWVANVAWAADDDLCTKDNTIHIINTNSKLRFDIGICFIFSLIFQKQFPEYHVSYDNTMKPSTITIKIPYENAEHDKKNLHTFMLQSSGSFTHSGPSGSEAEIGYKKFIEAMKIMENLIPRDNETIISIITNYL